MYQPNLLSGRHGRSAGRMQTQENFKKRNLELEVGFQVSKTMLGKAICCGVRSGGIRSRGW
jgi:hypothetical protein